MKRNLILTALLLITLSTFGQDKKPQFEALQWLLGDWEGQMGEATLNETWKAENELTLIGKGTVTVNGEVVMVEHLQIHLMGSHLGYIASPQDTPPTFFTLINSTNNQWVFENKEHDFPQRIIYTRKSPDSFTARIEGVNRDGDQSHQEFNYERKGVQKN